MKNITDYINENLVNEGFNDWIKEIATKGMYKAKNAWNKIADAITNDYTPHLPAIVVDKFECNPQEWEDANKTYEASLIYPVYDDIKHVVSNAIHNEVKGKDITLYAGGHYAFDACSYEMKETNKDILMERWADILDYCMKTYNKGNFKATDETKRYPDKNRYSISIELNNNGFYDYVNINMYL